ncbi:MAG: 30S ribosomal protein S17 [Phycisphaerae bacterium]|nr:30S ribosomal protein S17 [Phycisphaerae bacterium]
MTSEVEIKAQPKARRAKVGEVTGISGDKTVTVMVESLVKHPQYGKYMRRHKKLQVHDENGLGQLGALVEIVPCRRVSKSKAHRLVRIVRPVEGQTA